MLQNLLLVLVARFTLAFSLQRRRFLRAREFFFSRKRHVETTLPILLCHKIKDGGYNNTNMNKLSPTQNTLALRLPSFRRLISHHIGWLLRGHETTLDGVSVQITMKTVISARFLCRKKAAPHWSLKWRATYRKGVHAIAFRDGTITYPL